MSLNGIQLQWSTKDCIGEPNIILESFSQFNISRDSPYSVESEGFALGQLSCGVSLMPVDPSRCCFSNFDHPTVPSVHSAIFYYSAGPIRFTNGSHSTYASISTDTTINGYYRVSVLCDSKCHLGFQCDGQFIQFYGDMDCNGPMSENVIIGENYTSLYYGLVSTKIVEFDSKPSVWIAAVKWGLDWTNYFDRWFLTLGILSMTFNVTYIAIELYYRRDKPVTALIQISWLAYNIVWLLSGIYAPSSKATEWILETANILYGLSTLASVLYTAYIISSLFKLKTSQYAMYTVIVLLNFLLNFPFYFSNLVQYGNLQYLYEWNRFADIWIYFMFIFNLAPNAYFLQKYYELETMVQHRSELAFLFQLFRKNKIFTLLCLSHLLNFIGYVGLDVILTWTVLLGSDKAQNAAYMVETFMITVHFILAFYSLMYTKGIISGVQKHHPKSAISSIFPKAKSLPMN